LSFGRGGGEAKGLRDRGMDAECAVASWRGRYRLISNIWYIRSTWIELKGVDESPISWTVGYGSCDHRFKGSWLELGWGSTRTWVPILHVELSTWCKATQNVSKETSFMLPNSHFVQAIRFSLLVVRVLGCGWCEFVSGSALCQCHAIPPNSLPEEQPRMGPNVSSWS
jgi:hypothetical protein